MRYNTWKFQGQKPRLMKTHYDFFLISRKISFFTLLDKTKLYSWKFCKIDWHTLIIPENCTFFSWLLDFNMIFLVRSFWRGGDFEGVANHPRMKLWFRGEEVLIKEVFHLTRQEKIKKSKGAVTPSLDTVKLCAPKYTLRGCRDSAKKWFRIGKNWF